MEEIYLKVYSYEKSEYVRCRDIGKKLSDLSSDQYQNGYYKIWGIGRLDGNSKKGTYGRLKYPDLIEHEDVTYKGYEHVLVG